MRTSRAKTKSAVRLWTERILLLAGIGGIAVWAVAELLPIVWQDWAGWSFDREVAGRTSSLADYVTERARQTEQGVEVWLGIAGPESGEQNNESRVSTQQKPPVIGPDGLIGRVTIPRLRLNAIVREGTSSKTLTLAAGHIPGTSFPGLKGNVAIAGHRDTLFRGLRGIEKDDVIEFETLEGSFDYKVVSTQIVKPEDVGVLKPGKAPSLTLVTCYPFDFIGPAPNRFIVKAEQISQAKPDPVKWQEVSLQNQQRRNIPNEQRQKADRDKETRNAGPSRISFNIPVHHSRELAPGISMGITDTDEAEGTVYGWMWLMPDRRTMWLRDREVRDPVIFYSGPNEERRELTITNVTATSVSGYLVLAE